MGNVAGGMFNYVIGSFGRLDWIEHYLHVKPEQLERAKEQARALGVSQGIDPFMTLCFMALPVIPSLRITTRGVFDVNSQSYV